MMKSFALFSFLFLSLTASWPSFASDPISDPAKALEAEEESGPINYCAIRDKLLASLSPEELAQFHQIKAEMRAIGFYSEDEDPSEN